MVSMPGSAQQLNSAQTATRPLSAMPHTLRVVGARIRLQPPSWSVQQLHHLHAKNHPISYIVHIKPWMRVPEDYATWLYAARVDLTS